MLRPLLLTGMALAVGGCDPSDYQKPIAFKPHGFAVRANMAAQIIDPNPPANRPGIMTAHRPVLAVENYQKNEVPNPVPEGTDAKTTDADQ